MNCMRLESPTTAIRHVRLDRPEARNALNLELRNELAEGACQTDSNQSRQGQQRCPLCDTEAAPLGKSDGAVLLESGSG